MKIHIQILAWLYLLHHQLEPSPIDSFGLTVTAALVLTAGLSALIAGIV